MTAFGWYLVIALVVSATATARAVWRDYHRATKAEARAEKAGREVLRLTVALARVEAERDQARRNLRQWAAAADDKHALARHHAAAEGLIPPPPDGLTKDPRWN